MKSMGIYGRQPHSHSGFTLVELLASIAILALVGALLFAVFNQATKAWLQGESRVETFTQARAALDFMAREISQAIVTNNLSFVAMEDDSIILSTTPPQTLPQGNLAFIATVGDPIKDGMDLVEVVYRLSRVKPPDPPGVSEASMGVSSAPFFFTDHAPGPYKLIRRVSPFSALAASCRDYGNFQDGTTVPWDFYTSPATWMQTSWRLGTAVLATNIVSLTFQFQDASGNWTVDSAANRPFWNSTSSPAWQTELGGSGVPPAASVKGPALSTDMLAHAPALVVITMTMLDSRAAARYGVAPNDTARQQIINESARTFTTSVAIPNR